MMKEERVDKWLEVLGANLLAAQKAIIRIAMSYDDMVTAMSRFAMAQLDAHIRWFSAPARVKHLAKHARKMRVRKKNMRRIFG